MESIYRKIARTPIALLFLLAACQSPTQSSIEYSPGFFDRLEAGDIIVRMGRGFWSNYFRNLSLHDKRYSHVGIICERDDSLFVVHAIADELTPQGAVRNSTIGEFIDDARFGAVYRYPFDLTTRHRIAEFAYSTANSAFCFDWQFDLTTAHKLYCTELVLRAVNAAVDSVYLSPHLYKKGKGYITLDDIYLRPAPLRQIAWFRANDI